MAPAQHIDWLSDNVGWFLDLSVSSLRVAVPACPGWTVENVITHLAFGLGLAYPHALGVAPDSADGDAFADVPWPSELPTGAEVFVDFERTMSACMNTFRRTDPATACYTYQGPGVAAFWFRRAAIETTLHRMDVAEALTAFSNTASSDPAFSNTASSDPALSETGLTQERANDAIAESVEFALPLAARWSSADTAAVSVRVVASSATFQLGTGKVVAEITGDAVSVLAALWGRSQDGVRIQGDAAAADAWLSVVENAFGGR